MTDQQSADRFERDEIDLVDIWLNIVRYRVALVSTVLIVVALGLAAWFVLPEQYEHKLVLEIGGVWSGSSMNGASTGQFEVLESPQAVKVKIEETYADAVVMEYRKETGNSEIPDDVVVSAPEDTQIVHLEMTEPTSAEVAIKAVLQGIADRVLASHNQLLERRVQVLTNITSEQIADLDQRIEQLQASRQDVVQNGSVEAKGIALLMVDTKLQELRMERAELERELEVGLKLNTRPTQIIAGPVHGIRPAGPGLVLTLALSAIIGTVIGIALIVLLNVKDNARARIRASSHK